MNIFRVLSLFKNSVLFLVFLCMHSYALKFDFSRARIEESGKYRNLAFHELTLEKRDRFNHLLREAGQAMMQKKIFTSYMKTQESSLLFDQHYNSYFLRGLFYAQIGDNEKAVEQYLHCLEMIPPNHLSVLIELYELYFYTAKYRAALEVYNLIMQYNKKSVLSKEVISLVHFKKMLCLLKLEESQELSEMIDKYRAMDDCPYYFYAHAMKYYLQGDDPDGNELLDRAHAIFGEDLLLRWNKALIDSGNADVYGIHNITKRAYETYVEKPTNLGQKY